MRANRWMMASLAAALLPCIALAEDDAVAKEQAAMRKVLPKAGVKFTSGAMYEAPKWYKAPETKEAKNQGIGTAESADAPAWQDRVFACVLHGMADIAGKNPPAEGEAAAPVKVGKVDFTVETSGSTTTETIKLPKNVIGFPQVTLTTTRGGDAATVEWSDRLALSGDKLAKFLKHLKTNKVTLLGLHATDETMVCLVETSAK